MSKKLPRDNHDMHKWLGMSRTMYYNSIEEGKELLRKLNNK